MKASYLNLSETKKYSSKIRLVHKYIISDIFHSCPDPPEAVMSLFVTSLTQTTIGFFFYRMLGFRISLFWKFLPLNFKLLLASQSWHQSCKPCIGLTKAVSINWMPWFDGLVDAWELGTLIPWCLRSLEIFRAVSCRIKISGAESPFFHPEWFSEKMLWLRLCSGAEMYTICSNCWEPGRNSNEIPIKYHLRKELSVKIDFLQCY